MDQLSLPNGISRMMLFGALWFQTKTHGILFPWINKDDPTQIVKPSYFQMSWSKSPQLFCSTSETALDIAQEMLDKQTPLPPHPLKNLCLTKSFKLPNLDPVCGKSMTSSQHIHG